MNLEHQATAEDKDKLQIIIDDTTATAAEITLATILHAFDHMTTAEDDAQLALIDGEYLLVIQNTAASDITELDFTSVDISESSKDAASKENSEDNNSIDDPIPDDQTPVTPTDETPAPDIELPAWSLWVEGFDLSLITLPETVVVENSTLPDLSGVIGLLGEQKESLELDFDAVDADTPVVASIGSVKPVIEDWTSQADPFIDSDWNPIIEELYYTSEFV